MTASPANASAPLGVGNGTGPSAGVDINHIEESIESVRRALGALRYGHIGLTIHEGRVVQIDVTEKMRFRTG